MGDDLQTRVPVAGMADCQLGKPEVPVRVRMKQQEEEDKEEVMSLGRLWEEGDREREREREEERGGSERLIERERRRENILNMRLETWKDTDKLRIRKTTWR